MSDKPKDPMERRADQIEEALKGRGGGGIHLGGGIPRKFDTHLHPHDREGKFAQTFTEHPHLARHLPVDASPGRGPGDVGGAAAAGRGERPFVAHPEGKHGLTPERVAGLNARAAQERARAESRHNARHGEPRGDASPDRGQRLLDSARIKDTSGLTPEQKNAMPRRVRRPGPETHAEHEARHERNRAAATSGGDESPDRGPSAGDVRSEARLAAYRKTGRMPPQLRPVAPGTHGTQAAAGARGEWQPGQYGDVKHMPVGARYHTTASDGGHGLTIEKKHKDGSVTTVDAAGNRQRQHKAAVGYYAAHPEGDASPGRGSVKVRKNEVHVDGERAGHVQTQLPAGIARAGWYAHDANGNKIGAADTKAEAVAQVAAHHRGAGDASPGPREPETVFSREDYGSRPTGTHARSLDSGTTIYHAEYDHEHGSLHIEGKPSGGYESSLSVRIHPSLPDRKERIHRALQDADGVFDSSSGGSIPEHEEYAFEDRHAAGPKTTISPQVGETATRRSPGGSEHETTVHEVRVNGQHVGYLGKTKRSWSARRSSHPMGGNSGGEVHELSYVHGTSPEHHAEALSGGGAAIRRTGLVSEPATKADTEKLTSLHIGERHPEAGNRPAFRASRGSGPSAAAETMRLDANARAANADPALRHIQSSPTGNYRGATDAELESSARIAQTLHDTTSDPTMKANAIHHGLQIQAEQQRRTGIRRDLEAQRNRTQTTITRPEGPPRASGPYGGGETAEQEHLTRPASASSAIPGATAIVRGKAGRWVKLNGKQTHIPHHEDFSREVNGSTFTSPAGSTHVFKGGELYNGPRGIAAPSAPSGMIGDDPNAGMRAAEAAPDLAAHIRSLGTAERAALRDRASGFASGSEIVRAIDAHERGAFQGTPTEELNDLRARRDRAQDAGNHDLAQQYRREIELHKAEHPGLGSQPSSVAPTPAPAATPDRPHAGLSYAQLQNQANINRLDLKIQSETRRANRAGRTSRTQTEHHERTIQLERQRDALKAEIAQRHKDLGVRLTATPNLNGQNVHVGDTHVGSVKGFEQRYNLARVHVSKGYHANDVNGNRLNSFDTKAQAVAHLVGIHQAAAPAAPPAPSAPASPHGALSHRVAVTQVERGTGNVTAFSENSRGRGSGQRTHIGSVSRSGRAWKHSRGDGTFTTQDKAANDLVRIAQEQGAPERAAPSSGTRKLTLNANEYDDATRQIRRATADVHLTPAEHDYLTDSAHRYDERTAGDEQFTGVMEKDYGLSELIDAVGRGTPAPGHEGTRDSLLAKLHAAAGSTSPSGSAEPMRRVGSNPYTRDGHMYVSPTHRVEVTPADITNGRSNTIVHRRFAPGDPGGGIRQEHLGNTSITNFNSMSEDEKQEALRGAIARVSATPSPAPGAESPASTEHRQRIDDVMAGRTPPNLLQMTPEAKQHYLSALQTHTLGTAGQQDSAQASRLDAEVARVQGSITRAGGGTPPAGVRQQVPATGATRSNLASTIATDPGAIRPEAGGSPSDLTAATRDALAQARQQSAYDAAGIGQPPRPASPEAQAELARREALAAAGGSARADLIGSPGRSSAGRLRNFRSMSDQKLKDVVVDLHTATHGGRGLDPGQLGPPDPDALAAAQAAREQRGLPDPVARTAGMGAVTPRAAPTATGDAPFSGMNHDQIGSPARSSAGRMRNIRSMSDEKLLTTLSDLRAWNSSRANADREAEVSLTAEVASRGLTERYSPPGVARTTGQSLGNVARPPYISERIRQAQGENAEIARQQAARDSTAAGGSRANPPRPEMAGEPGRSSAGRLRNFGAMSDEKLSQLAAHPALRNDPEAASAVQAQMQARGLGGFGVPATPSRRGPSDGWTHHREGSDLTENGRRIGGYKFNFVNGDQDADVVADYKGQNLGTFRGETGMGDARAAIDAAIERETGTRPERPFIQNRTSDPSVAHDDESPGRGVGDASPNRPVPNPQVAAAVADARQVIDQTENGDVDLNDQEESLSNLMRVAQGSSSPAVRRALADAQDAFNWEARGEFAPDIGEYHEAMMSLADALANEHSIQEAKFTSGERAKLADKGCAMNDGSFPIRNASDLRNAVQAVGRAKNKAAAKRHIMKRAKALKMTHALPDHWKVQESAMERRVRRVQIAEGGTHSTDDDEALEAWLIAEAAQAWMLSEAHDKGAEPFSTSKTSNWVARNGGLPHYIQHIAHDLVEKRGMPVSQAIQMAIGIVKRWARGGGNVKPDTRAAAAKALAQWEAMKAKAAAKRGAKAAS